MSFAIVGILASLFVLLMLNRGYFSGMGFARMVRLALIWAVIMAALFLLMRVLGL